MTSRLGFRSRMPIVMLIAGLLLVNSGLQAADPSGSVQEEEALRELVLAMEAVEAGDVETALEHYRNALATAVSDVLRFQALLGLGSSYAAFGQPGKAVEPLESARNLEPGDARVWYTLGTVYAAAGETGDAVEALAEAGRLQPDFAAAHYDRCILLSELGRHADAADACGAAVQADADLAEAWVALGVAHFHMAAYLEAAEAFERALELSEDNARARFGLGMSLLYADDDRGAKEQYLALKRIDAELARQLYERIFP